MALPGVWNGLRSQDAKGRAVRPHLIPELQVFATAGRTFTFCFDHDTRPQTVAQVRQALYRTGLLLRREDCHVQIRSLPGPEKGVDDFVARRGDDALAQQARLQRLRVKEVLQKVRQIQLG